MVKITLEFKSADEAIVALAKLVGVAEPTKTVGAPAASASCGAPAAAAATPTTRTRKARADKGQSRAPYAPRATEAAQPSVEARTVSTVGAGEAGTAAAGTTESSKVGEQPAVSNSTTPAVAEAAPAPIPTAEQTQKALEKLFEAKPPIGGLTQTRAVLARFGAQRLRELRPESCAEFIAKVEEVLAGKPV